MYDQCIFLVYSCLIRVTAIPYLFQKKMRKKGSLHAYILSPVLLFLRRFTSFRGERKKSRGVRLIFWAGVKVKKIGIFIGVGNSRGDRMDLAPPHTPNSSLTLLVLRCTYLFVLVVHGRPHHLLSRLPLIIFWKIIFSMIKLQPSNDSGMEIYFCCVVTPPFYTMLLYENSLIFCVPKLYFEIFSLEK